jgi:hypothetical protein
MPNGESSASRKPDNAFAKSDKVMDEALRMTTRAMVENGLITQVKGILRPTMKGRAIVFLRRFGLFS